MMADREPCAVLVSDFDGTMTRHDFYRLVQQRLLPADTPDYWQDYRAGRITHFEAMRAICASIRKLESEVLSLLEAMEIDPRLGETVVRLRDSGWDVVVTSAGCEWYIRKLLARQGVSLRIHANPGRFVPGRGLVMTLPEGSKYFSRTLGIDKAAVVRDLGTAHRHVAFAGDGYPDIDAARLVPSALRFARGSLAEAAEREGLAFTPFDRWSDIAGHLLEYRDP